LEKPASRPEGNLLGRQASIMWEFLDKRYMRLAGSLGEVCFASPAWGRLLGGQTALGSSGTGVPSAPFAIHVLRLRMSEGCRMSIE